MRGRAPSCGAPPTATRDSPLNRMIPLCAKKALYLGRRITVSHPISRIVAAVPCRVWLHAMCDVHHHRRAHVTFDGSRDETARRRWARCSNLPRSEIPGTSARSGARAAGRRPSGNHRDWSRRAVLITAISVSNRCAPPTSSIIALALCAHSMNSAPIPHHSAPAAARCIAGHAGAVPAAQLCCPRTSFGRGPASFRH